MRTAQRTRASLPPALGLAPAAASRSAAGVFLSEAQLHHAVSQFLDAALPQDAIWHHSPNEGKRGWKSQRSLKRNGTRAGWPDIEIIWQGQAYFIELKSEKGRLTVVQELLQERLWHAGAVVATCRSIRAVEHALRVWGVPLRGTTLA